MLMFERDCSIIAFVMGVRGQVLQSHNVETASHTLSSLGLDSSLITLELDPK